MSNTIEKAVAYINNRSALDAIFTSRSHTADLEKPCVFIGASTVKIQQITFSSSSIGAYDRTKGYADKDINLSWVEKKLTQDQGNSLKLDIMDNEEAQADGIVGLHNKYQREIVVPTVDTYRFGVITGASGIVSKTETLTVANVNEAIIDAFEEMVENSVDTSALILYVNPTVDGLLRKDAVTKKGHINLGAWNGNVASQVRLFDTAKIEVVPAAVLGTGINFILVHPSAVSAQRKYQESVYHDTIPGYGHRLSQVDEGIYHDCYVQPGGEKGIYVSRESVSN